MPIGEKGEQLMFKSMELGELVRKLDETETSKKESNEEFNVMINAYRKKIVKVT